MASFDYSRASNTADRLLARFGQTGAIRRATNSGTAYDPTVTTADHACTFVVEDYSNREIDGNRVQATDKKVMLKAGGLAIVPSTADKLVIGGVAHSILRVETEAPGGVTLHWRLQCRR